MTILEKNSQGAALTDNYKFTSTDQYYAPADGKIQVYRDYIESLPLNDNPQIFGLHDNANITFMAAESNRVVETILSLQPRLAAVGGGLTPDEIVIEKAKYFLDNLPEILNPKEGLKDLFVQNAQGLIPSLSTVLL
jgi:dynein heavy chain